MPIQGGMVVSSSFDKFRNWVSVTILGQTAIKGEKRGSKPQWILCMAFPHDEQHTTSVTENNV